jgi:hypothetical protein
LSSWASSRSRSGRASSAGIGRVAPYWEPLATAVTETRGMRLVDPDVPRIRLGPFELERLLGCGGMGIVFEARDPELDRPVALKLWNLDAERAELALKHEALCQAQISHPNVVTIYETGKIGDDVYLAMEYVDGMDVRRALRKRTLVWQQILALFIHAGRGLAAVHARGLVHADFKPENVLLSRDGQVLVADFGLARAVGEFEAGAGERKHRAGGTRAYMAPERLEGRPGNEWSDQFSFCVALWECLHGVRPFAGETREELLASMKAGELRVGLGAIAAPGLLRKVLRKGLAFDPMDRYESVDELLRELHSVPTRVRWRRRGRVLGVVVGVVAVLVAVLRGEPGTEERSRSEDAHAYFWITPQPDPTLTTGTPDLDAEVVDPDRALAAEMSAGGGTEADELTVEELVAMIDGGTLKELNDAREACENQRVAARMNVESSVALLLPVARAFMHEARVRETEDPETALVCARNAWFVASSIPLEYGVRPQEAAAAGSLMTAAADMIDELRPRVEAQSKHSTVPSTLE